MIRKTLLVLLALTLCLIHPVEAGFVSVSPEPVYGGFSMESVTSGITASTTQSQGQQPLVTTINEISTVGNAGDAVTLPSAVTGRIIIIINNGANSMQVFPASGDDIDGTGANTAVSQGTGANFIYVAHDATNWNRIHGAL